MSDNNDLPSDSEFSEKKIVLVLPPDNRNGGELNLIDLWAIIWRGRFLVIAASTLFAVMAAAYALLATEWYRADVLLVSSADDSMQDFASRFGGLAGLAGINVGRSNSNEALAVLKSRELARSFISDRELLTVLLHEDWDEKAGRWLAEDEEDQPDIRDGIKYFDENVRNVSRDSRSQLVTLSVSWTDPVVAADWATDLVGRLNETMRQRALKDATRNIDFLRRELEATNISTLNDSIGALLESELQKLMLARGNDQFAFRIVDAAQVPKLRDWPKRTLIVLLAIIAGGFLGVVVVLVRHAVVRREVLARSEKT